MTDRIYLSPPHMSGYEMEYIQQAFEANWIAPLGPNVDHFEQEFAAYVGSKHAVALSSGTAALHLMLRHLEIQPGDEILVSSLTFCGSVNPIIYEGAKPIFIDSERTSWNMDPGLLEETLQKRASQNRLPKAVILVHLYGQSADVDRILSICQHYGIPLIEDAAESLGANYQGRHTGTLGVGGVFSFNGNKIITTSGGGMLVSNDEVLAKHARKLATQARDPFPHYEHSEIGYNYRMSNILAGIGRGQLRVLDERVQKRREVFAYYQEALANIEGLSFMPEAPWGQSNRWLTVIQLDPQRTSVSPEMLRLKLEEYNIESRPVWKPMHLQPIYKEYECIGGEVAEEFFVRGLCLPSGSALDEASLAHITAIIRDAF